MRRWRYIAVPLAVFAVGVAAACGNNDNGGNGNGALPLLEPAITGDVTEHGGAQRNDGDRTDLIAESIRESGAKNVILLIGDGMGDSEITVARDYEHGAGGAFPGLDVFPLTGQYTHYSIDEEGKPVYVTESAASASSWATGTKTYNGAISVDINGDPQQTLLQRAKESGKATGNVTTSEIQDATPAAQMAHISARKCYGPEETTEDCTDEALENGGPGSITEQALETRPDIILGGGKESFAQSARAGEYEGQTLEAQAKERGFQLVGTADELDGVTAANQDQPLLGLFAEGNMPVRWEGPVATRAGYLQEPVTCTENPERTAQIPGLAAMTQKSIDLLSDSEDGFFLQVEGASIDKQNHAANACGQLGETVDLDEAAKVALDFARDNGDTLVIVTADHAHTSQVVDNVTREDVEEAAADADVSFEEARDAIYPGLSIVLRTKEDSIMTVSYGTSANLDVSSQGHTGAQVRVAGYGPGAANIVGLTDQTDIFFTIGRALGLPE